MVETRATRREWFSPFLDSQDLHVITLPATRLVPASEFSFDELVTAYNQARVDYIVPMPMNAARLRDYTHTYDVNLRASVVVVEGERLLGLAMLGHRGPRTWITRLGVIPNKRRGGTGQMLMEQLIAASHTVGAHTVTLEVIENNLPAHRMFRKLGFQETRELLVVRRPPSQPEAQVAPYTVTHLGAEDAATLLQRRHSVPSWLDETPSLINAGNLSALRIQLASGGGGWLVYRRTIFQLSSLVLQTERGDPNEVGRALVHALHTQYPALDTKSENLPAQSPHWPAMRALGYIEAFRRIEMRRTL